MVRSFTDRVFGGVCGGIGTAWRVNPWLLRIGFIIFALISLGVGLALYVALWWALPQESLVDTRRGGVLSLALFLVITAAIVGIWAGTAFGQLEGPDGQSLLWPVTLAVAGGVFLLQQVRG